MTSPCPFYPLRVRYSYEVLKSSGCPQTAMISFLIQQRRDGGDARRNSRVDRHELRNYRLKVEIFQLGVKIVSPKSPQTRPEHCCVYCSKMRLYVDFGWDLVTQNKRVAFGVNTLRGRPDHNNPDHNDPDHNNPDHNNPDHNITS